MIKYCRLFLVVFILGLLITPLLHMNMAEITEQENRTLAKFPGLKKKGKLNTNYGKEFESWLGDRFWGRDKLLHLHGKVQFTNNVVRNKEAIYFKKNGWMFTSVPGNSSISKEKITKAVKKIQKFDKFCIDHGIKLYILIVPKKSIIYAEKFDEYLYDSQKLIDSYVNSMAEIEKQLGSMFILPYREFKNGSQKDFVFFKESHHWTEYGAFLGYMKLMDSIKRDFKDVKVVSLDDYKKSTSLKIRDDWNRVFNTGSITKKLNIKPEYAEKHILKTSYTYYDPLVEIKPEILNIPGYKIKSFKNPDSKAKYKVFLSGFSNNENLLQFLPYSFSELKYYRLNNVIGVKNEEKNSFLKRYKKDLLDYKPDILILTISNYEFLSEKLWSIKD